MALMNQHRHAQAVGLQIQAWVWLWQRTDVCFAMPLLNRRLESSETTYRLTCVYIEHVHRRALLDKTHHPTHDEKFQDSLTNWSTFIPHKEQYKQTGESNDIRLILSEPMRLL